MPFATKVIIYRWNLAKGDWEIWKTRAKVGEMLTPEEALKYVLYAVTISYDAICIWIEPISVDERKKK